MDIPNGRTRLTGNILSAYVPRRQEGRAIADGLLSAMLERFREMGLRRAVAAPHTASLEVESPLHLALLGAGFAFNHIYSNECYGVFLGGSLEGFRPQPEIRRRMDALGEEGIGKVVHHLGTEEVVRRGAQHGWTAAGLKNPARFIYRSVGFCYWYACVSDLSRRVR